jgi:hypothetical protein
MSVQVGDGAATKLWTDSWSSVGLLCLYAPQLFAALTRRGKSLSLKDGIYMNQWAREISGALTTPVLYQYVMVWELLRGVILVPTQADRFVWKWSPDGRYSASSAYRAFFQGSCSLLGASELWRARAPPKVKFFFWLAVHRRLWTAERRRRHGLQDEDDCALCGQDPETSDHLFVACVVARQVWTALLSPIGLGSLAPCRDDALVDWWLRQRRLLHHDGTSAFDTAVLLVAWCLWKERNNRTFNRVTNSLPVMLRGLLQEAEAWVAAGFSSLLSVLPLWSQHLATM